MHAMRMRLLVFVGGGALLLCLGSVLYSGYLLFRPPYRVMDRDEVSRITRLTFPSGATLLDAQRYGSLSAYMIARLRLPHSEVKSFLAQPPINGQVDSREIDLYFTSQGFDIMRKHGWTIPHPRRFLSTHFTFQNHEPGIAVLIDMDSPQAATLFLYYWQ